jgi:hypothetical protein
MTRARVIITAAACQTYLLRRGQLPQRHGRALTSDVARNSCSNIRAPGARTALHFRNDAGMRRLASALFRQRARAVILAGYAIESPRLLLNSASSLFPQGLPIPPAGGRCFMIHAGHRIFAQFPQRIGQYKAPPGLAITEHSTALTEIAAVAIEQAGPRRRRLTERGPAMQPRPGGCAPAALGANLA